MPPRNGTFAMPPNHLHIWPRGNFMLIALPNQDCSFTCTLFMPNEIFQRIKTPGQVIEFFEKYFYDAIDLIGKQHLIDCYFATKPSPLVSVKCSPHHGQKCVLLGDAAHAMVPFYGQGMNCGFEDVVVFFELLDQYGFDRLGQVLGEYSKQRVPDAHSICDLAQRNYDEVSLCGSQTNIKTNLLKLTKTFRCNTWSRPEVTFFASI
jgi:kynurenine 3-monooxygenase